MSFIAAVLIVTSAFMHAGWNYVSKRQNPSLAYFFVTAVSATLLISPVLIFHRQVVSLIPFSVWALVIGTGLSQMIYFIGLAGAYRRGDLSLAYPLARALPVLLVAAISFLLGNGSAISQISLFGMVLITAGCIILPLPHFKKVRLRDYVDVVYLMALLAAVGTTGYTMLDDQALRQLRGIAALPLTNSEITLLFIPLQTGSTAVMLGLGTLLYPTERRQLGPILNNRTMVTSAILTGVAIMSTYGLVLAAMAYVSDVSYVAAFRQLSIPIGAVLGLTLQQEPRYLPKLLGIGIVSVGLVLVGLG
ncbi:MAG: multidrug DMT transporter permease [Anaerolineaceae bacterium]|nr:multidrug DMT transporter permease [Anaerolineaceae bacterium]